MRRTENRPVSPYNKHCRQRLLQRGKDSAIMTTTSAPSIMTGRLAGVPSVDSHTSKVEVFVRVRPLNCNERTDICRSVVKVIDSNSLVFDPKVQNEPFFFRGVPPKMRDITRKANKDMLFEFNGVFGEDTTNEDVFNATTKRIIKYIFDGYNCSVFAYGATGAGKTYTMLGTLSQPGIIYMTIVELLEQIQKSDCQKVTLGASYIEVYNETVRDLLHPSAGLLQLREEGGLVAISGLVVEKIHSSDQLFNLLATGNENRSQHFTDSNAESSRSHAVFQVHVHMECQNQAKLAKLSMIDLAGSERGAATGCKGARFKEGSNINKSLLALGNCINSLADGLRHIPYRDSKLTRILKDSLGGNCQTMMIANISPSATSFEDTYNTLKYATRAKSIKTKLCKNVIPENHSIAQYKKMNEELQQKISELMSTNTGNLLTEIEMWGHRIKEIMEEKMRINKEVLTLQGQAKLIDWRLTRKNAVQPVQESSLDSPAMNRIRNGIYQLNGRLKSINERLQEYKQIQAAHYDLFATFKEEMNAETRLLPFLNTILEYHEQRIAAQEWLILKEYQERVIRLQAKREDNYCALIDRALPLLDEFYSLLRAHCHVTSDHSTKYMDVLRSADGVKCVTFEVTEDDGDIESPEAMQYLRLNLTPIHTKPDVPVEMVKKEQTFKSTSFPLKDINNTMNVTVPRKPLLLKGRTFIKTNGKYNENTPGKTNYKAVQYKTKVTPLKAPIRLHPYHSRSDIRMNKAADARLAMADKGRKLRA